MAPPPLLLPRRRPLIPISGGWIWLGWMDGMQCIFLWLELASRAGSGFIAAAMYSSFRVPSWAGELAACCVFSSNFRIKFHVILILYDLFGTGWISRDSFFSFKDCMYIRGSPLFQLEYSQNPVKYIHRCQIKFFWIFFCSLYITP